MIACAILVGEMAVLKRDGALGMGDASRRFAAVTLCLAGDGGHVHPVEQMLDGPTATTATWMAIVRGFGSLAG